MKNEIKDIREGLGWSQEYLAYRLKCSRQHVISIEKGKHDPSLDLALRIAKLFRRPVEKIFCTVTMSEMTESNQKHGSEMHEPAKALG